MSENQAAKDTTSRMLEVFGFDPAVVGGGKDAVSRALAEIKAEREAEQAAKAKAKLEKLIELRNQRDELRKKFESLEKETGKLLNELESSIGKLPPQ